MKKIGAFEAKTHFSKILATLKEYPEGVLIERRGKQVALLLPYDGENRRYSKQNTQMILDGFRAIREDQALKKKRPSIKAMIQEGRKY